MKVSYNQLKSTVNNARRNRSKITLSFSLSPATRSPQPPQPCRVNPTNGYSSWCKARTALHIPLDRMWAQKVSLYSDRRESFLFFLEDGRLEFQQIVANRNAHHGGIVIGLQSARRRHRITRINPVLK